MFKYLVFLIAALCVVSSAAVDTAAAGEMAYRPVKPADNLEGLFESQQFLFYILGPGDVLRITVLQHPEFSGTVSVAPNETITIPTVYDTIRAAGLTNEEVASEVTRTLEKYVKTPVVNVDVVEYNSKIYYVFGEVQHPGRFAMSKKIVTVKDAIVNAGLPTRAAVLKKVHVITPGVENATYKVVNLNNILYKGNLRDDIALKPGDVVYVPRNGFTRTADAINTILSPLIAVSSGKSNVTSLP